jgi:hypothetical protein
MRIRKIGASVMELAVILCASVDQNMLRRVFSGSHTTFTASPPSNGKGFQVDAQSWEMLDLEARLLALRMILRRFATLPLDAKLTWRFSPVQLIHSTAVEALEQWTAENEAPIASLIAIDRANSDRGLYKTRGLAALVGFELSLQMVVRDAEHDGLRDLLHIARRALNGGQVNRRQDYPGGGLIRSAKKRLYRIDRIDE